MSIKINNIIMCIINVVLFFFIFVASVRHYMQENLWVEAEDKASSAFIIIAVLVLAVVISFVFAAINRKPTQKTEPDYKEIENRFSSNIVKEVVELVILFVLQEQTIASFIEELFSIGSTKAAYLAGFYGIARGYLIAIVVVSLINSVLNLFIAKGNIDKKGKDVAEKAAERNAENAMIRKEIEELKVRLEAKRTAENSPMSEPKK